MLAAAVSRLVRQSWLHRCVYHGIAVTSPSRALATDASAAGASSSSSSGGSHVDGAHHFNVRAYYLGKTNEGSMHAQWQVEGQANQGTQEEGLASTGLGVKRLFNCARVWLA